MALINWLITASYHLLFLVTPFLFTWVNSELFQFNKMLFVYVMTVVIGGLWLAKIVWRKKWQLNKSPLAIILLIFLAGQVLATFFSIDLRTSLLGYYSRLNGGLLSSLAYVVLALGLINNVERKQLLPLLLTNIVAATLISLYAIPEKFGVSPSCYLMFQEANVACWKQDVQHRVFATFGQPNWLAAYLVGILPIAIYFAQKQNEKIKWLWWAAAGVMLLALLFTGSRSGLVALAVAAAAYGWFYYRSKIRQTVKQVFSKKSTSVIVSFALAGVGILTSMAIYRQLFPQQPPSFDLSQGTESASIRLIVWRGAAGVWRRYPWFGSGPGTFAYSYYQDRPAAHNLTSEWDNLYNKAHNEILNYLAETGLVGTTGYLIFLIGSWWLITKQLPKLSQKPTLEAVMLFSLIGLSTAHFFGFSTVTTNLLLFTLPSLIFLKEELKYKVPKTLLTWQKIVLALITFASLFLIFRIAKTWNADRWYERSRKFQAQGLYAESLDALQRANSMIPREPLYYDELADLYAQTALQYALLEDAETSTQLAEAAIQNSDYALKLNPRHLNFYKTRIRVFFMLAQINRAYYPQAERVLKAALALSPTDAQLWYNLGVTQQNMGKFEEAVQTYQTTVRLRPTYIKARSAMGDLLIQLGRVEEGRAQYQFILENLSSTDEGIKAKLEELDNAQQATPSTIPVDFNATN